MDYINQRIADLGRIIAGCDKGSAAAIYYIGRRDELKALKKKMKGK
jgi:hypothetical protein